MLSNLIVLVLLVSLGRGVINEEYVELDNNVPHKPVPCNFNSDCPGRWNLCVPSSSNHFFCQCKEGSSGENCTYVDDCFRGDLDCGSRNNASCLLGEKGRAFCQCDDQRQGFDLRTKTCRDCECGDKLLVYGCEFGADGSKKCDCDLDAYQNEEGKCVDCECGDGNIRCKLKDGVKVCKCFKERYAFNGTYCVDCGCGPNSECTMEEANKTVCTCKPGYLPSGPNGLCLLQCNASNPCLHGGTCFEGVCSCRNGTSGDLCRDVEECRARWTCGDADCLYDVSAEKAYCKCSKPDMVFDYHEKTCKVCDCGAHSKKCSFSPFKKCTCEAGYDDKLGSCELCSCKGPIESPCRFDQLGDEICNCSRGYSPWKNECKKCDCGSNGVCEFDLFFGNKRCFCNPGYSSDDDTCLECDCGDNGYCSIHNDGKAHCSCKEGFSVYQGKCLACECGENEICSYSTTGQKQCGCIPGYGKILDVCTACSCGEKANCSFLQSSNGITKHCICPQGLQDDRGTCKECDCGYSGNCSFAIDMKGTTSKQCSCMAGYSEDGGLCKECDCQVDNSNCTFVEGLRACGCPQGFLESTNSSDQHSFCQDVDECLDSAACPESASCVNTVGSYECVCGGDKPLPNVKEEGCPTTGGLGSLAIAGIVAGCIIGAIIVLAGADKYRTHRLKITELQASNPLYTMT